MSAIQEKEIEVCLRFLEKDEYIKLEHIYREYNSELPNPNISQIYIAEDIKTGEIIGFIDFVLTPTITMFINEENRHNGLWAKLVEGIYPLSERHSKTYVIATRKETEVMCERLGLRKIDSSIYVKE